MRKAWAKANAKKESAGHVERIEMMHRMGMCISRKCGRENFEKCRNPKVTAGFLECQGPKTTN